MPLFRAQDMRTDSPWKLVSYISIGTQEKERELLTERKKKGEKERQQKIIRQSSEIKRKGKTERESEGKKGGRGERERELATRVNPRRNGSPLRFYMGPLRGFIVPRERWRARGRQKKERRTCTLYVAG